ncbi:hypothetical protein TWF281_004760 [Arthrobotrys megalospora]
MPEIQNAIREVITGVNATATHYHKWPQVWLTFMGDTESIFQMPETQIWCEPGLNIGSNPTTTTNRQAIDRPADQLVQIYPPFVWEMWNGEFDYHHGLPVFNHPIYLDLLATLDFDFINKMLKRFWKEKSRREDAVKLVRIIENLELWLSMADHGYQAAMGGGNHDLRISSQDSYCRYILIHNILEALDIVAKLARKRFDINKGPSTKVWLMMGNWWGRNKECLNEIRTRLSLHHTDGALNVANLRASGRKIPETKAIHQRESWTPGRRTWVASLGACGCLAHSMLFTRQHGPGKAPNQSTVPSS